MSRRQLKNVIASAVTVSHTARWYAKNLKTGTLVRQTAAPWLWGANAPWNNMIAGRKPLHFPTNLQDDNHRLPIREEPPQVLVIPQGQAPACTANTSQLLSKERAEVPKDTYTCLRHVP